MNEARNMREQMMSQPSFWVEKINGDLYDSIMNFMDSNNMKQKDLAKYLGISRGRMSQIINDGDINFSLDKIIQIALKIGKIPSFNFQDKEEFFRNEKKDAPINLFFSYFDMSSAESIEGKEVKVISLSSYSRGSQQVENKLHYAGAPEEIVY